MTKNNRPKTYFLPKPSFFLTFVLSYSLTDVCWCFLQKHVALTTNDVSVDAVYPETDAETHNEQYTDTCTDTYTETDSETYIRTDDEEAGSTDWEETRRRWVNR